MSVNRVQRCATKIAPTDARSATSARELRFSIGTTIRKDAKIMSIEAIYRRITPAEFVKLQNDPKAAASFFGCDVEALDNPEALLAKWEEQQDSERFLSIGKDWHALHFLLTGDGELRPHPLPPPPLGNVVHGGTETEWECGYGKVRSLTPDEVSEVANALAGITVEELRSRFSVESFNTAKIYPHGRRGCWTREEAESVFGIYPQLVEFFRAAAQAGDMVLLSNE